MFVTMIRLISKNKLPFSLFAGVISVGYQWCLEHFKIRGYESISKFIVIGSRDDLFGQNREGIFSFFGSHLKIPIFVGRGVDNRISVDIFGWIGCWAIDFACESTRNAIHQIASNSSFCIPPCMLDYFSCIFPNFDEVFRYRGRETVR